MIHTEPAPVNLHGVGRTFSRGGDAHNVLRDINLDVVAGEVVALLGASGCGKSTLLRLIAGLDRPSAGEVRVDGHLVNGIEPRTAMVFQEPRLMPWRTLHRNVAFGLRKSKGSKGFGGDRAAARAEVDQWLDVVGLGGFADHRPRQVSGGMAQRAALARALARRPGVLLLDEPFASLDALTRLRMQDLVDEVQRAAGTTVLLVTHDVDEALRLADRIVLLGPDPDTSAAGTTATGSAARTTESGSAIRLVVDVPGARPGGRDDHSDPRLTAIRLDLLDRLGVPRRTREKETTA